MNERYEFRRQRTAEPATPAALVAAAVERVRLADEALADARTALAALREQLAAAVEQIDAESR